MDQRGGSVQATSLVAMPMSAGLIVLQYLVHPVWPPPDSILTIAVGFLAPMTHLVGRALYRKILAWAGPDDTPTPSAQGPQP